jgi:hypothetical protein
VSKDGGGEREVEGSDELEVLLLLLLLLLLL